SWSPDGTRVVYSRFTSKYEPGVRPLWSRNEKYRLFAAGYMGSYAPDGSRFAVLMFEPNHMSALGIAEDGKPEKPILERKGLILAPQWSPDGQRIAFGTGDFTGFGKNSAAGVDGGAQIGVVHADGSDFHLITSGPNNNAFPSYSPDGKRIVYRTAGPNGEGLRIMTLSDRTVSTLTNAYDNFPNWSRRGDLIVFMREIDGNFEIFTIRPDGTGLKQLTDCRCNEAHPAWSPDGERIVFTSSRMGFKDEALLTGDPQPYGEIFVMDKDGTHLEQLTDNQWEDGAPTWRPHRSSAMRKSRFASEQSPDR
ncbi:MAG: TolB family protein, partial [Bryobacteraceae bacterium]